MKLDINGMHPTAYLRIPKGKPLYGADCSYADEFIDVHCGFTYACGLFKVFGVAAE